MASRRRAVIPGREFEQRAIALLHEAQVSADAMLSSPDPDAIRFWAGVSRDRTIAALTLLKHLAT